MLADLALRAYTQRHKLVLSKDGLSLSYVAQPYYAVGRAVHVDRSLPITMEAGAGAVVANVRAAVARLTEALRGGREEKR